MEFDPFTPGLGLGVLLIALAVFRFQFLERAPAEGAAPPRLASLHEPEKHSPVLLLLVFLLLASGISASAYLSYANYERQFRAQMEQQLAAILELKLGELKGWRAERLGDAEALHHNPAFAALAQAYLENPQDAQTAALLQAWFDSLYTAYQYDRVFLLDLDGAERLASPRTPEPVAAHLAEDSAAALASGQVTFIDFHWDAAKDNIYLAVLVPVFAGEAARRPLGVLVLRIDPEINLYPYLQEWPIPSQTAETLLVRRDGESVLFLNPVRFKTDAALNLRIPLTDRDVLAVKAVLGQTGVVEGRDYRGSAVIGALAPVPATPWFLVARMDTAEIYTPLRARLWETSLFYSALLVLSGAGLLLFWRQQRMRLYRAQAEASEALYNSELRYRRLFEAARDGILILNAETGVVIDVNPFLIEMLGFPREDILGKELWQLGFFKDIAENKANFLELQQEEYIRYEDLPLEIADGRKFYVEFVSNVYQVDHHKVVQCNIRDITERKQAEEKLVQSHELLANLARLVPGVIYQYRLYPDGRSAFPYASPGMNDIYEVTPEDVQEDASPVFGRLHPDDYDHVANAIQESARTLQEFYCEFRVILPRQGLRWRWSQAHPERMADGGTLWHGIISDVTERKQAQEEIQQLNAELEKRVEQRTRQLRSAQEQLVRQERLATLGQLAGSIGHELRNPLGVISNAVYYLKMSQPEASEKVKEYLDIIDNETRISDKIVTDLLDFTRIKSVNREPAAVSELINQTLERYPAPLVVQVTLEIPADLPRIYADPQHVMQVIGNLVVNAYQAMETSDTRQLTVSATVQSDMIRIEVRDTGTGIPPENMDKLFEPLFTTKTKGIGLGLAVSKKLAEANGGRIEAQSEPGKGSTFIVYLPVYKEFK
jgi:PAS domain S-box-containing protein